jgi:hypothetical protein
MKAVQFSLDSRMLKIEHLNVRQEKHGPDEEVNAVDILLRLDGDSGILSELHPSLRSALFEPDFSKLKFPALQGELKWSTEVKDADLVIQRGSKNPMTIAGKADKFKIVVQEGGSCSILFSFAHQLDGKELDVLASMLGKTVEASLQAAQQEMAV